VMRFCACLPCCLNCWVEDFLSPGTEHPKLDLPVFLLSPRDF
jgi:hypothetical protein